MVRATQVCSWRVRCSRLQFARSGQSGQTARANDFDRQIIRSSSGTASYLRSHSCKKRRPPFPAATAAQSNREPSVRCFRPRGGREDPLALRPKPFQLGGPGAESLQAVQFHRRLLRVRAGFAARFRVFRDRTFLHPSHELFRYARSLPDTACGARIFWQFHLFRYASNDAKTTEDALRFGAVREKSFSRHRFKVRSL